MASIFNLDILKNANMKYNKSAFKYDAVLNKNLPNDKKRKKKILFTSQQDVNDYFKMIIQFYNVSIYIRNHIFRYCRNKRFKKYINEYKKIITMLLIADNKFGNKLNFKKNFYGFYKLFEDLKTPENKPKGVKSSDEMDKTLSELTSLNSHLESINGETFSKKYTWIGDYIRGYTVKLYKSVTKLIEEYNRTSNFLLESDHLRQNKGVRDILEGLDESMSTINLKHCILYYSFALTYQNILDYHSVVRSLVDEFKVKKNSPEWETFMAE